jgi:cell division protein FtsZ
MAKYNIKVLGIGGGGSNTVDFLMDNNIQNIQTYAMNTDDQALKQSKTSYITLTPSSF